MLADLLHKILLSSEELHGDVTRVLCNDEKDSPTMENG